MRAGLGAPHKKDTDGWVLLAKAIIRSGVRDNDESFLKSAWFQNLWYIAYGDVRSSVDLVGLPYRLHNTGGSYE